MSELKSKETGLPIKAYLGWTTTSNNVTFGCIKTTKTTEFYVYDGLTFDCDEKGTFIGSYPIGTFKTDYETVGRLIRESMSSDYINDRCKETLKNHYNDYYKYDDFFEEIA